MPSRKVMWMCAPNVWDSSFPHSLLSTGYYDVKSFLPVCSFHNQMVVCSLQSSPLLSCSFSLISNPFKLFLLFQPIMSSNLKFLPCNYSLLSDFFTQFPFCPLGGRQQRSVLLRVCVINLVGGYHRRTGTSPLFTEPKSNPRWSCPQIDSSTL